MTPIKELIERCRSAEGPDRKIEEALVEMAWSRREAMIHKAHDLAMHRYTSSIDAALALTERLLPGWIVEDMSQDAVGSPGAMKAVGWTVELSDGNRYNLVQGQATTLPLAIILATLSALSTQDQSK